MFPVAPAVRLTAQDLSHGLLVIELQKRRIGYRRGATEIKNFPCIAVGWSACCAAHEASTATDEVWLQCSAQLAEERQSKRGIWCAKKYVLMQRNVHQ
ncbi:unnamed protein product [Musa acuminata var. zebrina]